VDISQSSRSIPTTTTTTTVDDDWYEHGFSKIDGSRKKGVTSMPITAAQMLLKWAGYIPSADLAGSLVLDPACGSGNSLIVAAQALAARGRVRRWGAERVAQEIEKCIWGLDPDPVACHVTELRLHRLIGHLIPDLPAARRKNLQLHIHQTDSLSLPADARFQVVISNPPLATARGVVVSYGGFESKSPPRDVWLKFMEQSMNLVAWNGVLAIALPEALLTKAVAGSIRQTVASDWTLEHLAHLTGVFRAGPGTVLLVLRRQSPPTDSSVAWERIERLLPSKKTVTSAYPLPASKSLRPERRYVGTIPQASLAAKGPWRYAIGENEAAFLQRMNTATGMIGRSPLSEFVTVSRGADILKEAPEPWSEPQPQALPLLRSIDVEAFAAQQVHNWLPSSAFKGDVTSWQQSPKIVLLRASGIIQAAVTLAEFIPAASLLVLSAKASGPEGQEQLQWLLALLNSPAMRAYLALMQTAYMIARPTIDLDALRALPIATGATDGRRRLAGLAQELTRHFTLHGHSAEDEMQYPIGQRLAATLGIEIAALYGLTDEDQLVINLWQLG